MIGTRLGPFRVLAELGSGGMGRVYLAEVAAKAPGLEAGTRVALKVIHAHLLETPGFFKRFLREAEIGQSVRQDNVVRCFDCDAVLHGGVQQNFLVMEYVEGQTLRSLLQELERVPEELCRHVGREVAKGLQAIHAAGALHRDLKPENVLITPTQAVKIMDLGVARLQDETVRLSQTGVFVGSLEYAAPEDFRSGGEETDGRADLHALGVMLYELSTGRHPFRDDDARKVLRRIVDEEPRKAGELNPQLSPFFEEVVQTLLRKQPEARFPTAKHLAEVLEEGEQSPWWKERAKALRLETRRPLRRVRIPRETALYGRDDDLAKLGALYEAAKAGDGRVLLLEGEAGIGKTRLVDEFVGRLRQEGEDVNFLFGSYPPGGAATVASAFSTAYREHFGTAGLQATLEDYLAPTPVLIPAFAALLRGETTPTGATPLTKDSLQTVFVHATRALAAERPTIALIDDLHFAPEDGRALFASLALAVSEHRILLIGSMRPGVPAEWIADLERLEHAHRIELPRLGAKDLSLLLEDAFHSRRLAEELGIRIARKSDGNPFFTFEIIRGLREGLFITQEADGSWISTKAIDDIQVPSSVQDLVEARISELADADRNLLEVASCCGFEFDARLVGEVLGIAAIPALQRFARIETRRRLVRSVGPRYAFDHHQVREVLYEGLHDPLREEYHGAIGERLLMRHPAAGGSLAVEICEHLLRSGRGADALPLLERAADHLKERCEHERAIALLDRALAAQGLLAGPRRGDVLLRQAERLNVLGRLQAQKGAIDEALALAETHGDPTLEVRALIMAGALHTLLASYEEATRALERAREVAGRAGDRRRHAFAEAHLAQVLRRQRRYEEARAHLVAALATAREVGYRQGEAESEAGLGAVLWGMDRYEEARAHLERGAHLFRELGDRRGESACIGDLGLVAARTGKIDEARERLQQDLAICVEIGDRRGEAAVRGNLAPMLYERGFGREALDHTRRAIELYREVRDRDAEAGVTINLGIFQRKLGDAAEARRQMERGLELARACRNPEWEAVGGAELAELHAAAGRLAEARTLLERSVELAERIGVPRLITTSLHGLGLVLLDAGRYEAARSVFERCLSAARGIGDRRGEQGALANLGLIAGGQGRLGDALSRTDEALALSEELDLPPEVGICRENRGVLLSLLGRPEDARTHLEDALRIHRDLGRKVQEANVLLGLGDAAVRRGAPEDVGESYERSLGLCEETGQRLGAANALVALAGVAARAGRLDIAARSLDRVPEVLPGTEAPRPAVMAACIRSAHLGGEAQDALALYASCADRLPHVDRMEASMLLWRATGDAAHLREARRLLDHLVEHAPEAYRVTMLENVRLNREIGTAWAALPPG